MDFIEVQNFDLQKTLESGQFFHWKKVDDGYVLATGKTGIWVNQEGERIAFEGASKEEVVKLFGLSDNLDEIYKKITRNGSDAILEEAVKEFRGVRIMKQDPFECLVSYILSANSNIRRITKNVWDISRSFGREVKVKGHSFFLFPSAEALKDVELKDLEKLKLGFRAKYIKQTLSLLQDIGFHSLNEYDFETAKKKLESLPGVGEKVAECVLLYSFRRLEAFPIDIWMKRIITKEYLKKENASIKEIRNFARERFGEYAGYAQIYLFFYARKTKIK